MLPLRLSHLDNWNDQRRDNASFYQDVLSELDIITPVEVPDNQHVFHLYVIRSPHRDALRSYLGERGIGTGIHYPIPIHLQSAFQNLDYPPGSLPITEEVTGEILSLPMFAELTHKQINHVGEEIRHFMTELVLE